MKVIRNHNSVVALLVKQGDIYLHLLHHTPTGIEALRITEDELIRDWKEIVDYPIPKAVEHYQQYYKDLGGTTAAKKLLDQAVVDAAEYDPFFG